MNIIDYIPFGRENAVSRRTLEVLTGKPDSVNINLIAIARRQTPILNLQNGDGYFRPMPENIPLVLNYIKQETSRLKSIGWQAAREFVR